MKALHRVSFPRHISLSPCPAGSAEPAALEELSTVLPRLLATPFAPPAALGSANGAGASRSPYRAEAAGVWRAWLGATLPQARGRGVTLFGVGTGGIFKTSSVGVVSHLRLLPQQGSQLGASARGQKPLASQARSVVWSSSRFKLHGSATPLRRAPPCDRLVFRRSERPHGASPCLTDQQRLRPTTPHL